MAAIIARVTWLLALGEAVRHRRGTLAVPVYLGDSLQWNLREVAGGRDVVVRVPDDSPITIPAGFAENQAAYDAGLALVQAALGGGEEKALVASLARLPGVGEHDARAMVAPFRRLRALHAAGRDDVWPFVLRNLVRPLWLSRPENRADVVIGNPPWLAFRYMAPELQARVRAACRAENLWQGGRFATQQDLSALFWVRAAERYLKEGGTIAFLLPYAALNRPAYRGLREGHHARVRLAIGAAWSFDEGVQPLFPVPACALFARRLARAEGAAVALPAGLRAYRGALPRRDATEAEADAALTVGQEPWPAGPARMPASVYAARFRDGATIYPRRFFFVEKMPAGRLGANPAAPRVRGREGGLDKAPWKGVTPPEGPVEAAYLRPVVLGETILPFRLREPALAVMPLDGRGAVMDARGAALAGLAHLAAWLGDAEAKWAAHAAKTPDGTTPKMTLRENLDHLRKLSVQHPPAPLRVVYAKAGTLLAAASLRNPAALVDHMAYWAPARHEGEARYLAAVLNAEATRRRIAGMQARGQWGARHFDKLVWELRIPDYDARNPQHRRLAAVAERAERLAAAVEVREGGHFTAQRAAIRRALADAGVATELDAAVEALLGG
ncbi:hypothetical protein [Elioraea tepidiphila]|uniref:hypothetical protein n=1 Tax=Elioraea tepidiphila TaxID=457934 RepID=UPI0003656232|nr:hypothetical protein [Elioraea tepidiphila]